MREAAEADAEHRAALRYTIDGFDVSAPRSGLPPRAQRAACAIAEAMFERPEGPVPPERLTWLARDLDDYMGHLPFRARFLLRTVLWVATWLAPLYAWRPFLPLGWLPLERRQRALAGLEAGRLGLVLFGVRAMLCLVYYEHPDAAAELGWDEACGVL